MGLLQFFKMPHVIRRHVIRHYLNKISRSKSSSEIMGAKNLFKIFRRIRGLQLEIESDEYKLMITNETSSISVYARKYPSSDLITLLEVWGKQEYRAAIEMLTAKGIQEPYILDVGGNVGYSAVYFKYHFPSARIICVEPDQSNQKQISKNIKVNGFKDITLVAGALWRKRTKMEIKNDYREGTSASFYVIESDKGDIDGYGINDILSIQNWNHIDLLKVDIEGAEKYLFEDEHSAATILSITRVIAIEIHDEKADRQNIYRVLSTNGFKFFTKGETTFGLNENSTFI